jgi:hypothetical protein
MQVPRLAQDGGDLLRGWRRPRLRPQVRDRFVKLDVCRREQLRPGPLARAELAQPQLAAVLEADQQP